MDGEVGIIWKEVVLAYSRYYPSIYIDRMKKTALNPFAG
jgi:hypothetical protein